MLIQDPDPSPWLQVTPEMKVNNCKKPYGQLITMYIMRIISDDINPQMARRAPGFLTRPTEATSRGSPSKR